MKKISINTVKHLYVGWWRRIRKQERKTFFTQKSNINPIPNFFHKESPEQIIVPPAGIIRDETQSNPLSRDPVHTSWVPMQTHVRYVAKDRTVPLRVSPSQMCQWWRHLVLELLKGGRAGRAEGGGIYDQCNCSGFRARSNRSRNTSCQN